MSRSAPVAASAQLPDPPADDLRAVDEVDLLAEAVPLRRGRPHLQRLSHYGLYSAWSAVK